LFAIKLHEAGDEPVIDADFTEPFVLMSEMSALSVQ
jgi:hypothetical protein